MRLYRAARGHEMCYAGQGGRGGDLYWKTGMFREGMLANNRCDVRVSWLIDGRKGTKEVECTMIDRIC